MAADLADRTGGGELAGPSGLGNLAVLVEGDLRRARVPALTSVAYGLLQLGAVVRYGQRRSGRVAPVW